MFSDPDKDTHVGVDPREAGSIRGDLRHRSPESVTAQPHFKDTRISRNELFMHVAELYAARSSCRRGHVGAVAVVQGRILATGYNGAPANMPDCFDEDCIMLNGHCLRAIHAEANLISWAARTGTELNRAQLYTTHAPCHACSKLILQTGFTDLVYLHDYEENGLSLLSDSGYVRVHRYPKGPDY